MEPNSMLKNLNLQGAKDLGVDKGSLYITYNKYREFLLPFVVLIASALILLMVIIPQINQYQNSKNQLEQETQKLSILKNNYNYLISLNDDQAESDLKLLTKTLPAEKDFFGIMTSITAASSKVGISIINSRFTLGNLSKLTSADNLPYPTIQMELKTGGNAVLLRSFLNELYNTVPLVDISSVKLNNDQATIILQFFFKPFPPQNLQDDTPIVQLSAKDRVLVNNLYTWNNLTVENGLIVSGMEDSSSSANMNLISTPSSQTTYSPF